MSLFPLPPPSKLVWEEKFWNRGVDCVAGLDEAGRGAWAGPVVAAAVVLKPGTFIEGVDDSKKLSPTQRERLFQVIQNEAAAFAVAVISSEIIDSINILQASLLAMREAVDKLATRPGTLLIDGNQGIATDIPQKTLISGDSLSMSIGAASILAKVTRDRIMVGLETDYPHFHFAGHKGYGTRAHLGEIQKNGVQDCHRKSFDPMKTLLMQRAGKKIS